MFPSYSTSILTESGRKDLFVYPCDLQQFGEQIDVLVTSAFSGSYAPAPRTVFQALFRHGIDAADLARAPEIDLRALCSVWLSREIGKNDLSVRRIGCVEFLGSLSFTNGFYTEQSLLRSLKSFFMMLDIAAVYGIPMETVAMPLLGSGNQQISPDILLIPILNECIAFLRRNPAVKRLCFVERSKPKSDLIEQTLQESYNPYLNPAPLFREDEENASPNEKPKKVFISYSSKDKAVADALCRQLEKQGVDSWYAPRDVRGAYAESIMRAIRGASQFVVILSENSMQSKHVLNEIDAAFQQYPHIRLSPLRIDGCADTPSVSYYLNRQHCQTALPPDEEELARFAKKLAAEFKPD